MSVLVELPAENYSETAFANFSPEADFNLGTARAMIWASQLAYETHRPDNDTIKFVTKLWKFPKITPFNKRVDAFETSFDTCGIIAERGDATIVAFSGTDPAVWENIVTNGKIGPTPGADTHFGFTKAFEAVWETVGTAMTTCAKPIFITGHSLGAALAVLASKRASDSALPHVATYTFGLPRVGGEIFANAYNATLGATTYRLVHGNDVVAAVPMSRLGFRHVGRLLRCASDGKFNAAGLLAVGSDDPQFTASLAQGVVAGISAALTGKFLSPKGPGPIGPLFKFLPAQIRDHLPDRYIKALMP